MAKEGRKEACPTLRRQLRLPVGGAVAPSRSDWLAVCKGRGQVRGQRAQLWVGRREATPRFPPSPAPSCPLAPPPGPYPGVGGAAAALSGAPWGHRAAL